MIDGYLAFAKGEGQEQSVRVRLDVIVAQMIRQSEKLQAGRLAWQPRKQMFLKWKCGYRPCGGRLII